MSEGQQNPLDGPPKKSSPLTTLTWIVIALMLTLIAAWTVWAARQPDVRSLWAPE
jgi:hypothetical protein